MRKGQGQENEQDEQDLIICDYGSIVHILSFGDA